MGRWRSKDLFLFVALAPLGERVDRTGVFISRGGTGEGVAP
jgi:hypothetical protein